MTALVSSDVAKERGVPVHIIVNGLATETETAAKATPPGLMECILSLMSKTIYLGIQSPWSALMIPISMLCIQFL